MFLISFQLLFLIHYSLFLIKKSSFPENFKFGVFDFHENEENIRDLGAIDNETNLLVSMALDDCFVNKLSNGIFNSCPGFNPSIASSFSAKIEFTSIL